MAQFTFNSPAFFADKLATSATYSTARGATTGTTSGSFVGNEKISTTYYVYRTFTSLDTSSLPDDAVIESAIVRVTLEGKDTTNDFTIALTGHTSASDSTLADGDFDNITLNSPTEFASRSNNVSTYSNPQTHDFTLNASGIAAISKTGYSKFCFRNSGDVDNTTPTARCYVGISNVILTVNTAEPSGGFYYMSQ